MEGPPPSQVPPSFGASQLRVYTQVYPAGSPRSTLVKQFGSPRQPLSARGAAMVTAPYRPHMQHHFGYGWGDGPSEQQPYGSNPIRGTEVFSQRASVASPWQRHGDAYQQVEGLGASPHPFLKPSQRLHGCTLDAGLEDKLPPRASRKPHAHPKIKPHAAHFLSWPGTGLYVPGHKHHARPQVDSRNEARGELPPTAQMLISAGSRPAFPSFSIAGTKC